MAIVSSADIRALLRALGTTGRRRTLFRLSRSIGGADRVRTDDPLLAKQVLSQLSYSPGPIRKS
jgi:hypothetical protein